MGGADKEGAWQGGALAREELNLLAKLIGSATVAKARDTFNLNLFDDPNEEEQQALLEEVKKEEVANTTVEIDLKGGRKRGKEIDKIINEMNVMGGGEAEESDDLLSLMDKAL